MSFYPCVSCGGINRVAAAPVGKQPVCGQCRSKLNVSGSPTEVGSRTLARVLRASPVPVLVDFWAPWCGPCKMLAPVLQAVATKRAGELIVVKLNTDEHPGPAQSHAVSGLPTLVLFKQGAEVARQSGALPQRQLESWLKGNS